MEEAWGIVYNSDMWAEADKATIQAAVQAVGEALSPITGLDPLQAFNHVFGKVRFRLKYGLRDRHGSPVSAYSQWDIVWFRPHQVEKSLAIHELGHVLDQHILHGVASAALRDAQFPLATFRDGLTKRVHPEWQTVGFTAFERLPEMVMNHVLGSFADNEAGCSLRAWLEEHLREWVGGPSE